VYAIINQKTSKELMLAIAESFILLAETVKDAFAFVPLSKANL
jgi:hypothetical protein